MRLTCSSLSNRGESLHHSNRKCSLMHSMEQSMKHPKAFIGVNIRLWWRENTSDVVYCHFYLDLFFLLKSLLHIHCIFKEYSDNDLNKGDSSLATPKAAPTTDCLLLSQNSSLVHVHVVISPFIQNDLDLALPPCMLLYVSFPWNLSIFDMALSVKTPLLLLMSSRRETHWMFCTFLSVQTYFTGLLAGHSDQWQLLAK